MIYFNQMESNNQTDNFNQKHNHPFYKKRVLAFKYAFEGLTAAIKQEPNLKLHLIVYLLVVSAGIYFDITKMEWILVVVLSGLVFSVEMTNTAIEAVVDSFTQRQHPGAKMAKDISAAAVLVVALAAAIVGIIIFLPYLLKITLIFLTF